MKISRLFIPAMALLLVAAGGVGAVSGSLVAQNTAVPTANPLPSRTATMPPFPTNTPMPTRTFTSFPTNTRRPTQTPTPTATVTSFMTHTRRAASASVSQSGSEGGTDANGTPLPTWTPPPLDPAATIADHYMISRPIADGGTNWVDRTYPYGGTSGGRLQVHHGVEFINPRGTPILAVEAGTVLHAGDDLTTTFGPFNNYYGNLVVIQHNFTAPDGQPVFSLYGHMDSTDLQAGQTVTRGQQIGYVGGTGVALGAHLHFEIRVGNAFDFGATRNPELWIRPYPTYGTLAGRTLDAAGNRLYDVTIKVESTRIIRYAFGYADNSVNPDTQFGEHFTLGDLPAGYYEVSVNADGRVRFRRTIYIYPNRTTWLDVQLN